MKFLLISSLALLTTSALADEVTTPVPTPKTIEIRTEPRILSKIEPYFMYQHQSDIFRGPPFYQDDQREDPTNDYLAFGVKINIKDRWELDLSQGIKSLDCKPSAHCGWESGTQGSIRFYPWRIR